MDKKLYIPTFPSAEAIAELSKSLSSERKRKTREIIYPAQDGSTYQYPECYIAFVDDTIPGLTTNSDDDYVASYAECNIWKIIIG